MDNEFARNPNYVSIPRIRWLESKTAENFGLSKGEDMYELIENLQVLRFLKEPQATEYLFEATLC